jgi:hypothetical protein
MYPSSRSANLNASERLDSLAGSVFDRYPIRATFFGCCAAAKEAVAKKTVATSPIRVCLFIELIPVSSITPAALGSNALQSYDKESF